jgi:acetyltransferase
MSHNPNIHALFEPDSVAIIGASAAPGKIGNLILSNMVDAGYQGKIFPVNPKADVICGLPVYKDIPSLPGPLDLAVICVPPKAVIPSVQELVKLPTKAISVITAGFKEIGREGYHLEEELKKICNENQVALLGPNCLGHISTPEDLNASFAACKAHKGNIAFFSQSGALCAAILDWASGNNIGFSRFISLGNKAVLDEADMLSYLSEDKHSKVLLGYNEGIENGTKFMKIAREVTARRPVIMIKSGTTAAGAKAASSHTGSIAGSDQAYTAAFRQTGIIRVTDVASLFVLAQAFSTQPLPDGPNLAIITNSGGPGILAADAAENSQLMLAKPSAATVEKLAAFLPPFASLYNPIDIIGDAPAERYAKTLEIVLQDEWVHSVMVLMSPTASAEPEPTAKAMIELYEKYKKPIFGCFMGDPTVAKGREMLQNAGIPCYAFPEPAIFAINAMYQYAERKKRPQPVEVCYRRNYDMAKKIIDDVKSQGAMEIVEFQAQGILKAYEIPVPQTELARTSDQAVKIADRFGYPVVLKIASPQISHKSDVGGVKVNLQSADEVRSAFMDITSRAIRLRKDAFISGCLVQAQAPKGSKEVIIGFKRDPQFGPLILFGLGGIYVEVLKDVSFRLAPLTLDDAQEMIREIKSYPLLRGVRGQAPVDFKAIEDILLIMAQFALDFPEVAEAEFNPVLVSEHGAVVADIRAVLAGDA